ncbi:MAG TPA: hypothetical protein VGL44_03360 [Gaiellales bacterium]
MDLVYGYPAILIGLVAGFVAQRRGWRIAPLLTSGAIVFAVLVLHEATVPGHRTSPEGNGAYTQSVWAIFGLVNAGCWAFGVAMGVAVAETTRRADRI